MKCPNCGAQNQDGLRFCEQCASRLADGRLVVEAEPSPMTPALVCPNCGAENAPGLRFCEQCASLLVVEEPPMETAPSVLDARPLPTVPTVPASVQPVLTPTPAAAPVEAVHPESAAPRPTAPPSAELPKPAAARPRRRWAIVLTGGALVALIVAGVLLLPRLRRGGDTMTLPNVGDLASIDRDEAATLGVGVVDELFPQFEDVEPVVFESNVDGHRIMDVSFTTEVAAEGGGYRSIVIVSIDTADESISILESN